MRPFKTVLTIVALLFIGGAGVVVAADRGVVVYENADCIVIETSGGYTLAEWYSGTAWQGHTVIGDLNSYGMQDLIDLNNDNDLKVYIDYYLVSENDAVRWIYENNCDT